MNLKQIENKLNKLYEEGKIDIDSLLASNIDSTQYVAEKCMLLGLGFEQSVQKQMIENNLEHCKKCFKFMKFLTEEEQLYYCEVLTFRSLASKIEVYNENCGKI